MPDTIHKTFPLTKIGCLVAAVVELEMLETVGIIYASNLSMGGGDVSSLIEDLMAVSQADVISFASINHK
jgi:hypothetical protein